MRRLRFRKRDHLLATGAICLIGLMLLLGERSLPEKQASALTPPLSASQSPADQALREARQKRLQAEAEVDRERYAAEAWDPEAARIDPSQWRQQLMATSVPLKAAREAALRARELAQTTDERYNARRLLAWIECNLGHHRAELREARRLVALKPEQKQAWLWLRRAARCNGLRSVEQEVEAMLTSRMRR
jgi:hypothetical protein